MADTTNIERADKTWNPWHGCVKVSPGCKFCYMYRGKRKFEQDPALVVRSKTRFYAPLKWNDPDKVFTCSWSDFFIEQADEWRAEAWSIIRRTPHLTYQILTKRTERVLNHLPADWGDGYPNVHLGFSAERQLEFDLRWEHMKHVPANVLFLSAEPLLGPIDIAAAIATPVFCGNAVSAKIGDETINALKKLAKAAAAWRGLRTLDWVIVGGESGAKEEAVRPMHPDWARSLRDQCVAAGVPFFFKQWGEWGPVTYYTARGIDHPTLPTYMSDNFEVFALEQERFLSIPMLGRVGKKAAGRLLDGREWSEFPA